MSVTSDVCMFLCLSSVVAAIAYMRPNASDIFNWLFWLIGVNAVMVLSIALVCYSIIQPLRQRMTIAQRRSEPDVVPTPEDAVRLDQHRRQMQEKYMEKLSDYEERVVEPRREAKRAKQNRDCRNSVMISPGVRLQRRKNPVECRPAGENAADEAATSNAPPPAAVQVEAEPPLGAAHCVTVAMRTPRGELLRRRVLRSSTVSVLLDYLTSVGYDRRTHRLFTSYPRQCLADDRTLDELNIVCDVMLMVEELV